MQKKGKRKLREKELLSCLWPTRKYKGWWVMFMYQIFAFLSWSFRDLKIPQQTPPNPHPEHSWVYWLLVDPCTALSSSGLQTRMHFLRNWYQPKSWEESMAPPLPGDWKMEQGKRPRRWLRQGLGSLWEQWHVFPEGCSLGTKMLQDFPSFKAIRASPNYTLVKEVGTGISSIQRTLRCVWGVQS